MATTDGAVPGEGPAIDTAGPDAVLWDMDGTLVDSEKLWDISLADLAHHLGGELSAPTRVAMVGSSLWRTLDMMFDEVGLEHERDALEHAARCLTRRTEELFRAGLPWRPGALEALRMVRATGLATALVTSTERALVEVALDSIGREFFDLTVCGDEVPATKPSPDPYLIAAAKLGVTPGQCVVIEDSPTGATAATAAGCPALVVPSEVSVPEGPGRVQRESLVGLTALELREVWIHAHTENHWSTRSVRSAAPARDQ